MAAVISSLRGRGTCDTIVVAMGVVQTRHSELFRGSVQPLKKEEGPSTRERPVLVDVTGCVGVGTCAGQA